MCVLSCCLVAAAKPPFAQVCVSSLVSTVWLGAHAAFARELAVKIAKLPAVTPSFSLSDRLGLLDVKAKPVSPALHLAVARPQGSR